MPVDKEGNRADVILDPTSTISRMNIGRLYEHYINGASRDVAKRIKDMLGIEKGNCTISKIEALDLNTINNAYEYLLNFLELISEKQHNFYRYNLSEQDRLGALNTIVNDKDNNIKLFIPIGNNKDSVEMIKNIEAKFKPVYDVVSYIGNSGQRCTTKNKVRIAPLYLMLLEKIADDWSSISLGRLQHFGILSPIIKSEKFSFPFRNSPNRFIGETEGRIDVGYTGPECISEMMDRSNNPATQRNITWNILNAKQPTNIDEVVDRNLIELGGTKPINLVKHILMCAGFVPTYEPEENQE